MKAWSYETFAQLFAYSPLQAFEYRKEALGDEIPEEYQTKPVEEKLDKVAEYKKLLDEKGIKYSHLAGEKKLLELCNANNLL